MFTACLEHLQQQQKIIANKKPAQVSLFCWLANDDDDAVLPQAGHGSALQLGHTAFHVRDNGKTHGNIPSNSSMAWLLNTTTGSWSLLIVNETQKCLLKLEDQDWSLVVNKKRTLESCVLMVEQKTRATNSARFQNECRLLIIKIDTSFTQNNDHVAESSNGFGRQNYNLFKHVMLRGDWLLQSYVKTVCWASCSKSLRDNYSQNDYENSPLISPGG